jgi:N-acetyl-1-D-myo-inositol-2-amino-2-deoxy-alpha-D-glucopyranoside deacetylase
MAGTPSADHPRAFTRARTGGPDHHRAVGALARVIDEIEPAVLLTYDSDGGYGHPDHVAAHGVALDAVAAAGWRTPRVLAVFRPAAATRAAFARFAVPAGHLSAPADGVGYLGDDGQIAVAVPTAPMRQARRLALAAHATQVELLDGGFALSNRIAQPLADAEYFKLLHGADVPRRADGSPADDVFAGLG